MLTYPAVDPVAFHVLGLPVRWYGLAYMAGFLCAISYAKQLVRRRPAAGLTEDTFEDIFVWIVLGVILGGRLGYALIYAPDYFLSHPADILKTWHGGMSFHGGLLGVLAATLLFARLRKLSFFDLTDRLAPGVCFGLFFGRLANFINGELYGRITEGPWGMVFPTGGPLPRHPSQLYEAALEGLALFLLLHLTAWRRENSLPRYKLSGLFLLGYGTFRFFIEFAREPDHFGYLTHPFFAWISMGQLLCLPMILGGVFLVWKSRRNAAA